MAAFDELGVEAVHADLLEHTALPFRRLYRQAYFDLVRTMPDLVEWIGRRLDRPSERTSVQRRVRARAVGNPRLQSTASLNGERGHNA